MSNQLTPAILADPNALRQYPAAAPPPGVTPNFAHPESRGPTLVAVGGVMIALIATLLTNRIYTKATIVRKFSWDDLTVSLSALGALALYIACCWEVARGPIGKHQYDLHLDELLSKNYIIPTYVINVISSPTLGIAKFTFFLFYLQIFHPLKWLRISVYIGASISTGFYIGVSIAQFILASPSPHQPWIDHFTSKRYRRQTALAVPISSVGLAIDLYLLILPSVAVSSLQMSIARKIGLMLIFGTGLIAVAASAVSVYYRYENNHTQDSTWAVLPLELLTLVEIDVGVMTACLPAFARMLHHYLPPWKSLKSRVSLYRLAAVFSRGDSFENPQKGQSDLGTPRKDSKVPALHGSGGGTMHHAKNLGPYANLESKIEQRFERDLELGPMTSVKTFIGGGRGRTVEEDGIYLKHDISQGWSSEPEK